MSVSIGSILPKPKAQAQNEPEDADIDVLGEENSSKEHPFPPYGQRENWKPTSDADYGGGGAFPEIHIAQYPLGMGKKKKKKSKAASADSKALTLKVDSEGKVDYGAIARQGHDKDRIVQTSYNDLVPLRQRANAGDISLARPSEEEIRETTDKTKAAIDKILGNKVESAKPSSVAKRPDEPTYIRYTPSSMMGQESSGRQRILKVVDVAEDPMAPPKFKHTKVPTGPPSPPAPVLRSPPRKLTAQDQEEWYIPPSISNWKNPKGFTIALDKRVAADGRRFQDVAINDNKAKLAEALYAADRSAREEIRERAAVRQKLAEKENAAKDERLRQLAQKAREERLKRQAQQKEEDGGQDRARSESRSPSRTPEPESDDDDETEESRKREAIRRERKREAERELRRSRMGTERKIKEMAREEGRDISERVALGVAKPSQPSGEAQFDSRLFGQVSGSRTFNEDEVYDRSLFAGREALQSIYRPRGGAPGDAEEEAQSELDRFAGEKRFEALGKASKGFQGADSVEAREGPVEFEKDDDPFGVGQMIEEVEKNKNYGLDDSGREKKRQRTN
uniref:Pre-mRNA-processing protein 45 n=1 Tax=Blastobotrys adeninivorans TaxID=409370 RepID=A0A060TG42_BLAAD